MGNPKLSLHAYYNYVVNDLVTERLKGHLAYWHEVVGWSDTALAAKIRADGIDILIDLSGHTTKHRLLTVARKPAPIQASWIGYPGTTGLISKDHYLADRFLGPLGKFDYQFTKKIVSLPAIAPFQHIHETPSINILPSLKNGHATFGNFNQSSKIDRPVVALWSQLLLALPNSRMRLAKMPKGGNFDWLVALFALEGIQREQLILYRRCDMEAYLNLHHQVDICLDTFPYNGSTTSCHARWMGGAHIDVSWENRARQGRCLFAKPCWLRFIHRSRQNQICRDRLVLGESSY